MKKATGRPPIQMGESTIRVGFTINEKLWEAFKIEATDKNRTYSELFREILEVYLTKELDK